MELILETYQELDIQTPAITVYGVQSSMSLPSFAWMLGTYLSLRFRYDILREKFIGFKDTIQYKEWNLLGYPIHEKFETYLAFPDNREPNQLIAITRNYEKDLNAYFLPQYPDQDFFIFFYEVSPQHYPIIENIPETNITLLIEQSLNNKKI